MHQINYDHFYLIFIDIQDNSNMLYSRLTLCQGHIYLYVDTQDKEFRSCL